MTVLRRYGFTLTVITVAFGILLGLRPLRTETIVGGYAIALAAIALAAITRALAETTSDPSSRFVEEVLRKHAPPARPTELIRVSRELTLASSSAGHVHERFRPLLRDIAEARLGIDLDRRADLAREKLGDDLWNLVRADAPAPVDRQAPGLPLRRIRTYVDTLERL